MAKQTQAELYAAINARVIESMRKGVVPWRKPWAGLGMPRNAATGRPYRGINAVLLSLEPFPGSPRFLTFNQARSAGGMVRKGEKSIQVILWKPLKIKDDKAPKGEKVIPLMRTFNVFHTSQCDDLPERMTAEPRANADPTVGLAEGDRILAEYVAGGPTLTYGGDRACYSPALDTIRLPERSAFVTGAAFFGVAFHECGHSTGHATRLKRDLTGLHGDHSYSREELVAEMTAAFVLGAAGIDTPDTVENTAAYLRCWTSTLADDTKALVWAAGRAQKAADMVLGIEVPGAAKPEPKPATAAA